MGEDALLYCGEFRCGVVWGKAFCPRCKNQLSFIGQVTAFCDKCRRNFSHTDFELYCPRCYSQNLYFKKDS